MPRDTTIPAQVVQEEIYAVEHHIGQFVRVLIGRGAQTDAGFVFSAGQVFEAIDIRDAPEVRGALGVVIAEAITDYSELVSEAPGWAPYKPAGTFRNVDLWQFIDVVRSRNAQ